MLNSKEPEEQAGGRAAAVSDARRGGARLAVTTCMEMSRSGISGEFEGTSVMLASSPFSICNAKSALWDQSAASSGCSGTGEGSML